MLPGAGWTYHLWIWRYNYVYRNITQQALLFEPFYIFFLFACVWTQPLLKFLVEDICWSLLFMPTRDVSEEVVNKWILWLNSLPLLIYQSSVCRAFLVLKHVRKSPHMSLTLMLFVCAAPRIPLDKRIFTTTHSPGCVFLEVDDRSIHTRACARSAFTLSF